MVCIDCIFKLKFFHLSNILSLVKTVNMGQLFFFFLKALDSLSNRNLTLGKRLAEFGYPLNDMSLYMLLTQRTKRKETHKATLKCYFLFHVISVYKKLIKVSHQL